MTAHYVPARIAMIIAASFMGSVFGLLGGIAGHFLALIYNPEYQDGLMIGGFLIVTLLSAVHEYHGRVQKLYAESASNLMGLAMMVLAMYGLLVAGIIVGPSRVQGPTPLIGALAGLILGGLLHWWHSHVRRSSRLKLTRRLA